MRKTKAILLNSCDGYDQVAKQYQKMQKYLDEFEQDKLFPLLGNLENKIVLDVGVGTGRLTKKLIKSGADLTVLDISKQMLKILQKKIKKDIKVVLGNAENLPFVDNSFDIVLATFLIVHLKNLDKFFNEVYRTLKPGGKFVFSNINQKEPIPVKTKNNFIQIESFYHRPQKVVNSLEKLGFKIEKDIFVKENGIWINEIISIEK